jgi:hypothetical protein
MKTNFNKKIPRRLLGCLMAFAMVLFSTNVFSQCDHTLNMYDAYGDGWDGSGMDVTVNGAVVVSGATVSLTQGTGNSEVFSASSGDAIDLANWTTGSWTSEVSWDITDGDGTIVASGVHGGSGASTAYCAPPAPCDHTLNMYDSYGDGWDGSGMDVTVNGAVVVSGATVSLTQGTGSSEVFSASSGDAIDLANWTTGSWTSEVSWDITDGSGAIVASGVHGGSGASSGYCPAGVGGCMDAAACNFDAAATFDDGSCIPQVAGYDCLGNCLSGTQTDIDVAEWVTYSWGGPYMYTLTGYGGSWTLTNLDNGTLVADEAAYTGSDNFSGCLPDGCYEVSGISGSTGYSFAYSLNGGAYTIPGAADAVGTAQFAVGAAVCTPGCTDATAFNFDALAQTDDGSCVPVIPGCMDDSVDVNGAYVAANYNPAANTDDGSCTYGIPGCDDATACNFDPAATANDGTCTFAVAPFDCAGDCANGGTSVTITVGGGSYDSEISW